jgi:hypothetical protein
VGVVAATRRARGLSVRPLEVLGAALAAILAVAGGVAVVSSAQAAPHVGPAGRLELRTNPDPLGVQDMPPGATVHWEVTASLLVDETAELWLAVDGAGAMSTDPAGLTLEVRRCGGAWSSTSCPSGDDTVVLADAPVASRIGVRAVPVGAISAARAGHLLAIVRLPATPGRSFAGSSGTLRLVLTAGGDTATVSTRDPARLATTGAALGGPLALSGGLLLGGIVLAAVRGRRNARAGAS